MGKMPNVPLGGGVHKKGGQFFEKATNIFDFFRNLFCDINEVYAAYNKRIMPGKVEGTTVSDVGSVTMKLKSGMIATISNTCILPNSGKVGLDLYSDEGVFELRNDFLRVIKADRVKEYKEESNPYIAENKIFLEAVKNGDPSKILSDYQDALKTHQVTMAANQSALSGQPINLE